MRLRYRQMVDVVDSDDQVIGTIQRRNVLRSGVGFRVSHLFLFNDRSEILLQRLASGRGRHPGCWGSSVAAYVYSGESYLEAVTRRTREELGINVEGLEVVGKTSMADEGCTKFITAFSGRSNGPFTVAPSHISQVRFLPMKDLQRLREAETWRFTPTFVRLMDHFLG